MTWPQMFMTKWHDMATNVTKEIFYGKSDIFSYTLITFYQLEIILKKILMGCMFMTMTCLTFWHDMTTNVTIKEIFNGKSDIFSYK